MNSLTKLFYLVCICLLTSCRSDNNSQTEASTSKKKSEIHASKSEQFKAYWYAGKAELNSYALKQSRYGEIREGEVVLVFVTEPFSNSKQVKLDYPNDAGEDKVTVMKLNNFRKFTTGIYDYSIVTSTFTPIDVVNHPHTLKLNTSVQEWCGHTFTQLNLNNNIYDLKQFSYFESVGDSETSLPVALLEEELMTRIRLKKGKLPLGEIDLIISTLYSRFANKELKVSTAKISETVAATSIKYTIDYLKYNRLLSIEVEKDFPYRILSWTENNGDGLITEAHLKKSINEPYWNQKSIADETKREALQLVK